MILTTGVLASQSGSAKFEATATGAATFTIAAGAASTFGGGAETLPSPEISAIGVFTLMPAVPASNKSASIVPSSIAVSYTHLDVYKRQMLL